MKIKTLPEEKKWLLHNLAHSPIEQQRFIELVTPLLDLFGKSDLPEAHYGGYAVELWLFKPYSDKYNKELSLLNKSKKTESNGWLFTSSKLCNDDCFILKDDVLLKHHLHSYLWFKDWNFSDNSEKD